LTVHLEITEHIATITLDRPERRNAIDAETSAELSAIWDQLQLDSAVWAVVITGTGDQAFCAGADLKSIAATNGNTERRLHHGGFAGITEREFAKPVMAAVNGAAVGGGFEVCLACDLVIADTHATFALPEVKRGLVAAAGGMERLPRRLPLAIAMELALTGEPIDAARAHQLGVVNKVTEKGGCRETAREFALRICANAPLAVQLTKHTLKTSGEWGTSEVRVATRQQKRLVLDSADAREGRMAFAERRPPRWSGT
jgi:enoyl-CoA hydratase